MPSRAQIAVLALASILFGVMAFFVRLAAHAGFGTWEIVTWRMAIGTVGCLPFFLREKHTTKVQRPGLLAVRILIGATAVLTYFWSLALLPVGLAALFNYLGPVFTTVFAARFLSEKPGKYFGIGMAVALTGVAITLPGLRGGSLLGAGVGLLSAVLQGGAVTFIRELRRTEGSVTIFFWFALATTLLCAPFAAAHFHLPTLEGLAILFGVGLSSLGAQLLLTEALGHVPVATAAILSPLTPLTGFTLGTLLLAEPLSARVLTGAAVAIVGVVVGMRSSKAA
jgi:drug/metabolite transporter (DMT)-like permease